MNHILNPRLLTALTLLAIITAACHKKASSDFRLERYEYAPGETLDLINLSPKKRHQRWEILNPDGGSDTIVEGQAPQLTLNVLGKDGMYMVRVYDNKKELSKNVASEKTFKVSAAERGQVIIYTATSKSFPVYIDNQMFTGYDGIQYKLPYGVHAIKASCIYYVGGPTHTLDTVVTINSQSTKYLDLD
jgi:hypothetical protein